MSMKVVDAAVATAAAAAGDCSHLGIIAALLSRPGHKHTPLFDISPPETSLMHAMLSCCRDPAAETDASHRKAPSLPPASSKQHAEDSYAVLYVPVRAEVDRLHGKGWARELNGQIF